MNKAIISVPLHKVHGWRIDCNCGGYVEIGSGAVNVVEKAICPKCKTAIPLDDITNIESI